MLPDAAQPLSSITELLALSHQGRPDALQLLYARLYPEIKRVARARLAQSGGVAGLNTTALVHEGFLRMAEKEGLLGPSRGQFFAYIGKVLRSIVIDHLRADGRDKRGGDRIMVTMSAAEAEPAAQSTAADLLAIDRALRGMADLDPQLYELLEMATFTGLTTLALGGLLLWWGDSAVRGSGGFLLTAMAAPTMLLLGVEGAFYCCFNKNCRC